MIKAIAVCCLGVAWVAALVLLVAILIMGGPSPASAADACPSLEEYIAAGTTYVWPNKVIAVLDLDTPDSIASFAEHLKPQYADALMAADRVVATSMIVGDPGKPVDPILLVLFRDGCPGARMPVSIKSFLGILDAMTGEPS